MSFKSKIRSIGSLKVAMALVLIVIVVAIFWVINSARSGTTKNGSLITSTPNTTVENSSSTSLSLSTVRVTGKIAPVTKSELGFDRNGVVSTINVKVGDMVNVGDVLVNLDSTEAQANVSSASANLSVEESGFKELERGLRAEEYSVERSKVVSAEVTMKDATLNAQNSLREALVGADKAARSYVGTFFTNSQTSFPDFNISINKQNDARALSVEQTKINDMFKEWKSHSVDPAYYNDTLASLRYARANLEELKHFFALVEVQISALNTENTSYSQDEITDYRSTMTSANELLNTAFDNVVDAEGKLLTAASELGVARNEFTLKKSGTSIENLGVARAKVDKARAELDSARAQLSKTTLVSPINGVVSWLDIERGETVTSGKSIVNVISNDPFKIEVFVPEVDIANIRLGNEASVTLDAYGPDISWKAAVSAIDPAETIVEGVSTYKVTLRLTDSDARIKSGMTANIEVKI